MERIEDMRKSKATEIVIAFVMQIMGYNYHVFTFYEVLQLFFQQFHVWLLAKVL